MKVKSLVNLIVAGVSTLVLMAGCTSGTRRQQSPNDIYTQQYQKYIDSKFDRLYSSLIDVRPFWGIPGCEDVAGSYFIPAEPNKPSSARGKGVAFFVPTEAVLNPATPEDMIADPYAMRELSRIMEEGLTRRQIKDGKWKKGLADSEVIIDDVRIKSENLGIAARVTDIVISPIYDKNEKKITQVLVLYLTD